jgi:ParB family chromosome partitioning protein
VKKYGGEKPPQPSRQTVSPEVRDIEDRLRTHLGTKVNLHHSENGGSIVIHYFSDEELNTLLTRILKE